jgi:hypothetical protein
MLADALKRVLEPGCEVVGTVGDGRALLEGTRQSKPWLTMVDTRVEVSGFVRPRRWG